MENLVHNITLWRRITDEPHKLSIGCKRIDNFLYFKYIGLSKFTVLYHNFRLAFRRHPTTPQLCITFPMPHTKPPTFDHHGWLQSALHLHSPFHNERPTGITIDTLVLHNISLPPEEYGEKYIDALFLGTLPEHRHEHPYLDTIADLQVSTHFYIARDGHLRQYVPIFRRAWHAGVSSFRDRTQCNDFSIGVELNGSDHHPYTLKQYQSLASLTQALFIILPALTPHNITTHQHIAPERKTDPGPAFNHAYFLHLLQNA